MSVTMKIEGMSDYLRTLEKAPDELIKAVKTSMRKAGNELAKSIRPGVPAKFRKLVRCKVAKAYGSRNLSSAIGLFKGRTSGKEIPQWFKAYWKNYGTLSRRDPSHRFDSPVKGDKTVAAKRRRNRLGQFSEGFWEDALPANWTERYMNTFVMEMKKQGYDI